MVSPLSKRFTMTIAASVALSSSSSRENRGTSARIETLAAIAAPLAGVRFQFMMQRECRVHQALYLARDARQQQTYFRTSVISAARLFSESRKKAIHSS